MTLPTTILSHAEKPVVRHQNNFHFVRFLAAVLVLFGHSYALTNRSDWMAEITLGLFPSASMGVCLFLIISGYLITQSLENSPTTAGFIRKRVLRIFPGLLVSVLLTVLLVGPLMTTLPVDRFFAQAETYMYLAVLQLFPPPAQSHLAAVFNHLPGVFESNPVTLVNGSLWTLCYEVSFYLVLLIVARLGGFAHRHWLLAGTALAWVCMLLLGVRLNGTSRLVPILHLNLFETLNLGLFFAAGSLARLYHRQFAYTGRYALLALLIWVGTYELIHLFPVLPLPLIRWVRYPALSYLVLYVCFLKGPLNRFGDRGDVSYGLYIYGFPVQQMLIVWLGVGVSAPLLIMLSIMATLPLAIGSWVWVEQPALQWKKVRTQTGAS